MERRKFLQLSALAFGSSLIDLACTEEPKTLTTSEHKHYPFSFSPFHAYIETERELLKAWNIPETDLNRDYASIEKIVDDISDQTALSILKETRSHDIREVIDDFPRDRLMQLIAHELINKGIRYGEESLFTRGFDPRMHSGTIKGHLDCDLLTYVFLHVASRLDVEMYPVDGPLHSYLWVPVDDNTGYVIEPTAFRKKIQNGNITDYSSLEIGDGFFSSWDRQKNDGSIIATDSLIRAAGWHTKIEDEEKIRLGILASVLTGISDYAEEKTNEDLQMRVYQGRKTLIREGYLDFYIVDNFYTSSLRNAKTAIGQKDFNSAKAFLDNAFWTKKDYSELISIEEPIDEIIKGEYLFRSGQTTSAFRQFDHVQDLFNERRKGGFFIVNGQKSALNEYHVELLNLQAEASLSINTDPVSIYNSYLVPAGNFFIHNPRYMGLDSYQKTIELIEDVKKRM